MAALTFSAFLKSPILIAIPHLRTQLTPTSLGERKERIGRTLSISFPYTLQLEKYIYNLNIYLFILNFFPHILEEKVFIHMFFSELYSEIFNLLLNDLKNVSFMYLVNTLKIPHSQYVQIYFLSFFLSLNAQQ